MDDKDGTEHRSLQRTRSFDEEPKQPANIPDVIEHALQKIEEKNEAISTEKGRKSRYARLTRKDVTYLFSGAPQFMLEKGRHNHWYPHVIFPWDMSLPIQDLWDREPMRHESFTLATLHAHLPVPMNLPLKDGDSSKTTDGIRQKAEEPWKYEDGVKRPTYDLGIFEVPNMLSMNGKEPGAVGFRHFLELATADSVRYKPDIPKETTLDPNILSSMSLTEAFNKLSHLNEAYSQCNQDVVFDRHKLLCEGPTAWKGIGVRDVQVKDLVERLAKISDFRVEALEAREKRKITILNKESTQEMHKSLYTKFLLPPPRGWNRHSHEEIKSQIEVLTRVLAVKGAWLNLSLPEWRLRVGQILWEMPPHADGDCMDCPEEKGPHANQTKATKKEASTSPILDNGLERKWLLLQLVLAGELLLRLDAIVHSAVLERSKNLSVTAQDMRELDKLRHGQVNWNILLFQRFSDNLIFKYLPKVHSPIAPDQEQHLQRQSPPQPPPTITTSTQNSTKLHGIRSKFGSISQHLQLHRSASTNSAKELASTALHDQASVWDCVSIVPRHPTRQLKGIAVFAEIIGWPGHETLQAHIQSSIENIEGQPIYPETVGLAYGTPVKSKVSRIFGRKEAYSKQASHQYVVLHGKESLATTDGQNSDTGHSIPNIGGWLSRSWLTGLVMPGESISHLLMATLLENDPNAIESLGMVANMYGGLSYGDQELSWWSMKCIVGRVLGALEGSKVCMGWVKATITPVKDVEDTTEKLRNTWFTIEEIQEPLQKNTRIRQATKMAIESKPLGNGRVANDTFTIPVDDNEIQGFGVKTSKLTFLPKTAAEKRPTDSIITEKVFVADQAQLSFDITTTTTATATTTATTTEKIVFPLKYDVKFISSYTCRPPKGSVTRAHKLTEHTQDQSSHENSCDHNKNIIHSPHLPGHPLHKSYTYKHVPLQDLRPCTRPPVIECSALSNKESSASDHPGDTIRIEHKHEESQYKAVQEPIWILDARSSHDKEVFARAWCAAAGVHALIGRVGRTCLACCVREARAIEVGVVIRVGSTAASKPSCC